MEGLDLSMTMPGDAVAALRSYPRRFRGALVVGPDEDRDELARQVGPGGLSAYDAVADTTSTLVLIDSALRSMLRESDPVINRAVLDPTERSWDTPPTLELDDLLDMLGDACASLADTADGAALRDWSRTARLAGGESAVAIDVVREAVRTGAGNLRVVGDAMCSARRHS